MNQSKGSPSNGRSHRPGLPADGSNLVASSLTGRDSRKNNNSQAGDQARPLPSIASAARAYRAEALDLIGASQHAALALAAHYTVAAGVR